MSTRSARTVKEVFGNFSTGLVDYYEIEGIMVNKTPLHIGSGADTRPGQTIDNPIIRLPNGEPYIPGSSVKGVFRSIVESYLLNMVSIAETGGSSKGSHCFELFKKHGVKREDFMKECRHIPVEREEERKEYCINHGLFGGPDIASHVQVFDLMVRSGYDTFIRPGVAIDRFLGAQYFKALYKTELVSPGVEWEFRMRIYGLDLDSNDTPWMCAREALAFLLEYIYNEGFHLGGRTSTGLGYMVFKDPEKLVVKYVYISENGELRKETLSLSDFIKKLRGEIQ